MSRHGEITLAWGDGEYKFRLGIGELRQLQEACNAGPARIAARLRPYHAEINPFGDSWFVDDVREPLRLGLIGGGMTQHSALSKIVRFVDSRPLRENLLFAWAVINAAISGTKDEPLGKADETEMKATVSPMEKSPLPDSMELAQ